MLKKVLSILFLTVLALALIGCSGKKGAKGPTPSPSPSPASSNDFTYLEKMPVTKNLSVTVYVDGTASMAGYTNKNSPSVFKTLLKNSLLEILDKWDNHKIEFVRFGDRDEKFKIEESKFEKEDFYEDKDTRLDEVINKTDNKNLSIIITDLFQTNQHYTSLSNALETKCFGDQSDRSFAIIGVKSQFKGKIYDIANHAPIEYNSVEGNVATYRPFYMLVIGKDADVKVFTYEFDRKFKNAKAKVCLFTKEYGYDSKLALGKDFGRTKTGFQNKGDMDGIIHIKAKTGNKVNDKLAFTARRLPVDIPSKYKVEITNLGKLSGSNSSFFDKIKALFKKEKAAYVQVDNKELVTGTTNLTIDEANIQSDVNLTVDAKRENEGKYKVTLGMFPSRDDYVNSQESIFKEWNFDEDNVPPADAEIGKKTQSISAFTRMVAEKHWRKDNPGIRNIEFYLDVE